MPDIPSVDDLLDPALMRAAVGPSIEVETIATGISLRKPRKSEWFQANPDPELTMITRLLEHQVEDEKSWYYVYQPVLDALAMSDVSHTTKLVQIFTCINRRGAVFLWAQPVPGPEGTPGRSWHKSALEVAASAMTGWVSMEGDKANGTYRFHKPLGVLPDPEWGAISFRELIRLAFRDRTITSGDHKVIRDLRGEE